MYMAKYLRGSKWVTLVHTDLEVFKKVMARVQAINPNRTIYYFTIVDSGQ